MTLWHDIPRLLESPGSVESEQGSDSSEWETTAVRIAHHVLSHYVPGAAFDGEPFMVQSVGRLMGKAFLACNCFYHTVAFIPGKSAEDLDAALIFSREEGGMVPWYNDDSDGPLGNVVPDSTYYETGLPMPPGTAARILAISQDEVTFWSNQDCAAPPTAAVARQETCEDSEPSFCEDFRPGA